MLYLISASKTVMLVNEHYSFSLLDVVLSVLTVTLLSFTPIKGPGHQVTWQFYSV